MHSACRSSVPHGHDMGATCSCHDGDMWQGDKHYDEGPRCTRCGPQRDGGSWGRAHHFTATCIQQCTACMQQPARRSAPKVLWHCSISAGSIYTLHGCLGHHVKAVATYLGWPPCSTISLCSASMHTPPGAAAADGVISSALWMPLAMKSESMPALFALQAEPQTCPMATPAAQKPLSQGIPCT